MAKAKRKRVTGYTVGRSPIRRRKLNGVRRKRRMNAALGSFQRDAVDVVQVGIGGLLGGVAMGMAAKLSGNQYVRGAGAALVGVLLARMVPQARSVAIGFGGAGVMALGMKAMSDAGVAVPGAINATRKLTPAQTKALADAVKRGRAQLNGDLSDVMNGRDLSPVMNGRANVM
jgi:hypothetical protein